MGMLYEYPDADSAVSVYPLSRFMDNVPAARLGKIVREVESLHPGDDIDRGLILRRLLEEHGFVVGVQADIARPEVRR